MSPALHPRPVYIAAFKREIASLVRGWRVDEWLAARQIHLYSSDDAVVACAGMGGNRALLAIEAALALGPAAEIISVGFAGSCSHRFSVGSVIAPEIVVDAQTGERFFITEPHTTEPLEIIVTVATPANPIEKRRLGVGYYAGAVDMEAATVARNAQARGIAFSVIKTISDAPDFELPELARFTTPDGQFREIAFGLHAALRPWLWSSVLKLAKGSTLAQKRLHVEIQAHIQTYRDRRL